MRLSACGKLTLSPHSAIPAISGTNLIVFPEKLAPDSWIKFRNPVTGRVERLKR